jgi:hypothetical protein
VNINMLRDADNDAGFYAAASGDASWRGATLFQSADGGASYQSIATFTNAATMGQTVNALGDFHGGNIPDELNSLTVRLTSGELSSISFDSFIAGIQQAVIGDEIAYFRNAALNSDGTYTLTGFMRGRRGSEYAMSTHVARERFVLLNPNTMVRVAASTSDIGRTQLYKAVTSGGSLGTTAPQSFKNEGAGLKPYAPVQVGGGRNAAGDLIINWTRRTRIGGEWRDNVDVPLGETREQYQVDILNGASVVRTLTVTTPTMTYAASDQVADFGSAQSSITVSVYQISEVVGRGYPANATI